MVEQQLAASADALLIAHAEADLEKGLARLRARIRATHGAVAGATIDALVSSAIATLRIRSRRRDDAHLLVSLARRVAQGEDARGLAEAHLAKVLRLDGPMGTLARENDPEFERAKAMLLDLFVARLPDLARMASVREPEDYDDLVRRAFGSREQVDALVDDNAARVLAVVDHVERNPHVLRVPQNLTPRLAQMARDMITWQRAEARRGVEEIYRA